MRNRGKLNQIVSAIVRVPILVLAAGMAFAQLGGGELLGTTTFQIAPSSPTLYMDRTAKLSVPVGIGSAWTSSNPDVVSIVGDTFAESITVKGKAPGQATITAITGPSGLMVKTIVTVRELAIIPMVANVSPGGSQIFSINNEDESCNWSKGGKIDWAGTNAGASVTIQVRTDAAFGDEAVLDATCHTGSARTRFGTQPSIASSLRGLSLDLRLITPIVAAAVRQAR